MAAQEERGECVDYTQPLSNDSTARRSVDINPQSEMVRVRWAGFRTRVRPSMMDGSLICMYAVHGGSDRTVVREVIMASGGSGAVGTRLAR